MATYMALLDSSEGQGFKCINFDLIAYELVKCALYNDVKECWHMDLELKGSTNGLWHNSDNHQVHLPYVNGYLSSLPWYSVHLLSHEMKLIC